MQDKKHFVDTYLKPLIIAMRIGVKDVRYEKRASGEEVVIITYTNDYSVEKCVTADSLPALTRDAIKGL